MSAFIIADIAIKDHEEYKEYTQLITSSLAKYQGEYLVRGGEPETLDGAWRSERIIVMRYPNREAAKAWLNDPELLPIHNMRRRHSHYCNMIVCDTLDP